MLGVQSFGQVKFWVLHITEVFLKIFGEAYIFIELSIELPIP